MERTYKKTHPWIDYELDLRRASHKLWLLLGEAKSKCEHIAGAPLLPEAASELYAVYLAKGALATTAIEGNTLTEQEVRQRIEGKLQLPPSKDYLGQEIDNIIEASNRIAKQIIKEGKTEFSPDRIKEFNHLILRNLPLEEDVVPGEIRKHSVVIGRYRGAPAEDCEFLLKQLCDWLNESSVPKDDDYKIVYEILKAIVAHIYIAWIHPFGDGNGRTARLIEFQLLLCAGVPAAASHLLSNHYNLTRSEYYRQLDIISKTKNIFSFIEYALQGFVDQLREQIELIKEQQLQVHWINYIHERFRDKDSKADVRRRHLIIDLSNFAEPVPLSKVSHISPRLAEEYAKKSDKTIKRDIILLEDMGLVEQTKKGVRAKKELMAAFLSPTIAE